jgi:hypothetical protein
LYRRGRRGVVEEQPVGSKQEAGGSRNVE